jgi:hypothetical protein
MRILIIVLICATVVFSQNTEAPAKEKIAVYVTGNVRVDEKKALGTKILVELINSGRYRAVERSDDFVKELDREQSKQMSGAVDDNQITAIGRQFGVQIICVADLTPAFGSYQISARLIDVESAEIITIAEATNSLESIDDLTVASKEVVRVILGGKSKRTRSKSSAKAKSQVITVEKRGTKEVLTVEQIRSIGARVAFGNAMNFDAQITTIATVTTGDGRKKSGLRTDLMLGYCGGFKSDYYEEKEVTVGWYTDDKRSLTTKPFSAFELVSAIGWPIGNTDYNQVSGYISFANALYIGSGISDIIDVGIGGQMGLEYNTDNFVFGIDFRPMYYYLSTILSDIDNFSGGMPGFRYTVGLSVRYRF